MLLVLQVTGMIGVDAELVPNRIERREKHPPPFLLVSYIHQAYTRCIIPGIISYKPSSRGSGSVWSPRDVFIGWCLPGTSYA